MTKKTTTFKYTSKQKSLNCRKQMFASLITLKDIMIEIIDFLVA